MLLLPQLFITLVFFYWPASQAVWQSFLLQDAFGTSTDFVWFENYQVLLSKPEYYKALMNTVLFSVFVGFFSLSIALLLAVMADRQIRGSQVYTTLLIWPYAVAPAIAGVLWMFMFNPSLGMVARGLHSIGYDWNPLLNGNQAMTLVIMAAVWKQISYNFLFFLAGLQSVPKSVIEAATIDGARPWRRFWTIVFPLLSPTTFFLLVVNVVYVFFDTFGIIDTVTGGGPPVRPRHWCTRSTPTARVARPGWLGRPVGHPAGDGHRAHGDPVSLHRTQGELLMVEDRRFGDFVAYVILTLGVLIVAFPLYITFVASTWDASTIINGQLPLYPGPYLLENYHRTLFVGTSSSTREPVFNMMFNSLVMALAIAFGKIFICILSAYAVVYYRFPLRMTAFWLIFVTLMLPVEVRIFPPSRWSRTWAFLTPTTVWPCR